MEIDSPKTDSILKIAWIRFAELDVTSAARSKLKLQLNRGTAMAGILITVYAFITQSVSTNTSQGISSAKLVTSLIPIIVAGLAAYTRMFNSSLESRGTGAAANEILKEIYFFRSILKQSENRRAYIEKRLEEIQLQVFKSMGGELTLKQYSGQLPPNYDPHNPNSDPGFNDLHGDEYYRYRIESQLSRYRNEIKKLQDERIRMQVLIIVACVLIAILFVTGGIYKIGVELLVSLSIALLSWQESRNIDQSIKTNSKIVFSLMKLHAHWNNLEAEERTAAEFYRMVRNC